MRPSPPSEPPLLGSTVVAPCALLLTLLALGSAAAPATGAAGRLEAASTPEASTPTPPAPSETVIEYGYGINGVGTLGRLVRGSIKLTGSIDVTLTLPSRQFSAQLSIDRVRANLTALAFLPVSADVTLRQSGEVTGSLVNGKLNGTGKARIALANVRSFGIPVAGGSNCQTRQVSAITIRSTQERFYPTEGGPVAGTFAFSSLTGCGALAALLSPFAASSGNLIAAELKPLG